MPVNEQHSRRDRARRFRDPTRQLDPAGCADSERAVSFDAGQAVPAPFDEDPSPLLQRRGSRADWRDGCLSATAVAGRPWAGTGDWHRWTAILLALSSQRAAPLPLYLRSPQLRAA